MCIYIHIYIYKYVILPDDLPLWGFIGDVVTNLVDGRNVTNYHLFTHYIFTMTQNGEGQVVNISTHVTSLICTRTSSVIICLCVT